MNNITNDTPTIKDTTQSNNGGICSYISNISKYYNAIRDKTQQYIHERWGVAAVLGVIYFIRLIFTGGFHALTYLIGINCLNAFILFISPFEDPEDIDNGGDSYLPQKNDEEFKPFKRKMNEYHFWEITFWSLFIGIFITFIKSMDIPVFWPLLLFYFILVFCLVMHKQISHMIKYNYLPWDAGKKTYDSSSNTKK